ncbi:MAG: ADP compounds hydrolase NudE [Gammaproteobacteria bacterium]|nr:ADP compounds hydrolase NudE [Gammaproteobacteria bacterium]
MAARKKPDTLRTATLARTRIFHIEQVDLRFANGAEVSYERLRGSGRGAVLVVPMLDDDTVLLIREYCAGVDRYELALPKGRMEPDEAILDAANRELMEETGYGARKLSHLTTWTVAPNYLNHTIHIVLAQDLYPERQAGDEPEEIEVVPWKLSNLGELLTRTDVTEARSIAALFMARELSRRGD